MTKFLGIIDQCNINCLANFISCKTMFKPHRALKLVVNAWVNTGIDPSIFGRSSMTSYRLLIWLAVAGQKLKKYLQHFPEQSITYCHKEVK